MDRSKEMGSRTRGIGYWTLDIGHWTPGIGHWIFDIRRRSPWILDGRQWMVDIGRKRGQEQWGRTLKKGGATWKVWLEAMTPNPKTCGFHKKKTHYVRLLFSNRQSHRRYSGRLFGILVCSNTCSWRLRATIGNTLSISRLMALSLPTSTNIDSSSRPLANGKLSLWVLDLGGFSYESLALFGHIWHLNRALLLSFGISPNRIFLPLLLPTIFISSMWKMNKTRSHSRTLFWRTRDSFRRIKSRSLGKGSRTWVCRSSTGPRDRLSSRLRV